MTRHLPHAIGCNGTPSFVIGDALTHGFVEQQQLEALVDKTL